MRKIILSFVILLIFFIGYQIIIKLTKINKKIKKKQYTGKNKQFINLYNRNKELHTLLLKKYDKQFSDYEIKNYEKSYTPKSLLDNRVRIHIDLDNDEIKDTVGL